MNDCNKCFGPLKCLERCRVVLNIDVVHVFCLPLKGSSVRR